MTAPVPMSVIDADGNQVAFNPAFGEFLGYSRAELHLVDVARLTRPEDLAWTRRYLGRLTSGEIDRFESDKVYVRRDGVHVHARLSARVLRDADGGSTYVIGAIVPLPGEVSPVAPEVPERLLEFAEETITLIGLDGRFTASRGAMRTAQGVPRGYWTDRTVQEVVPASEWVRLADARASVSEPGQSTELDVHFTSRNRGERVVAAKVINCVDDPVLEGYVVVTRDVTDERAVLAELAEQRRTAEEAVDAQHRLLATVSHDLRNPLHALLGTAELLVDEDLPPGAAPLAATLVRQLTALADMTQDLLDASRSTAGELTIEPVPTELAVLADDVVELGRATLGDRPVVVEREILPGVPPWVLVDPNRLRQVLGNLVGNAVKFTSEGSVRLVVRPGEPGSLVFSVVDTGVGIPEVERDRVMEPFRVGSNAGGSKGAGLGLAIAQRLVAAMGGTIELSSQLGSGSRFDVRLPVGESQRPDRAVRDELPSGVHVLIVEDNPVNQQLARRQLERLGLVPVVVGTGEEGLERLVERALRADRFEVVLLDQQLPGWSGTETAQRIRTLDGEASSVALIGISASTSRADRDAYLAAGMDDFIPKPATLDDLSAVIGATLARRGVRPEMPPRAATVAVDRTVGDDGPVIDPVVLAALVDDLGDESVVAGVVRTFLDTLDERLAAIVGASDETAARRAAHSLGSAALLVGATALGRRCRGIEKGTAGITGVEVLALRARTALAGWLAAHDAG